MGKRLASLVAWLMIFVFPMAMMAAENLLAGLRGEVPPNCVNPEVLPGS